MVVYIILIQLNNSQSGGALRANGGKQRLVEMVLGFIRSLWRTEHRLSREDTLLQMVKVRKRKDPRLRRERLAHWTMGQLWHSPEGLMLDLIEDYVWLIDAGLTEALAVEQLERVHYNPGDFSELTFPALFVFALEWIDEDLVLDGDVLRAQLTLGLEWVYEEMKRIKAQPPFPRQALRERIGIEDVTDDERGLDRWPRIEARITERDQLWRYAGGHRAGIVLIRGSCAIAEMTTVTFAPA
jgi:hypothetical protein